jgi:membrane protein implicated in regulation of membrane protease activity
MFEAMLANLPAGEAMASPALVTVYWACAVVGVGLILLSALGSSHGHTDGSVDVGAGGMGGDMPADMHMDVGADVPADTGLDLSGHAGGVEAGAPGEAHFGGDAAHGGHEAAATASTAATWFSMRFVVFFVGVFGIIGLILTYMTGAAVPVAFGVALVSGLAAGQGVHQTFRRLDRTAGNSTPTVADYVNQIGRVTIAIRPPKTGEVAIAVRGGQRYLPAASKHPDAGFAVGDEVAVVDYCGGVASVVSRKEFEFVRQTGGATRQEDVRDEG